MNSSKRYMAIAGLMILALAIAGLVLLWNGPAIYQQILLHGLPEEYRKPMRQVFNSEVRLPGDILDARPYTPEIENASKEVIRLWEKLGDNSLLYEESYGAKKLLSGETTALPRSEINKLEPLLQATHKIVNRDVKANALGSKELGLEYFGPSGGR